jgi:hypothetical protein
MSIPSPKEGNLFLLFHQLPYDFSQELLLALGPSVCLDKTPQAWLDSSVQGLADYLLPGYSLPGMGLNQCCLRCFADPSSAEELSQKDLLFLSVLALRLHTPIRIRIGGQFRVGDEGDRILEPTLHELSSPWYAENIKCFTSMAVAGSAAIAERLVSLAKLGLSRLQTALIYFSHVTLGLSTSFQLSYLGLFAALEALFVPSGNKAVTISRRISQFLANFQFPE